MDNVEEEVDFTKNVEDWDYIQSVQFQEQDKEERETQQPETTVLLGELLNDRKGAKNLIEEVYATTVPASRFKEPEVQQAMREEENKWLGYEAYEVVPDDGQERLT